jgi:hypothetical protein
MKDPPLEAARKRVKSLRAELALAERELRELEKEERPIAQLERAIFAPIARQMRASCPVSGGENTPEQEGFLGWLAAHPYASMAEYHNSNHG